MTYKEVIANNWHKLLPKKDKYTKRDISKIIEQNPNFTESQARFIIECTAMYNDTEVSDYIENYNSVNQQIKRMYAQ